MIKKTTTNITIYQNINELLDEWTEGIKNQLGEKVVGLYLSGSLSYGDFIPRRSDIDLHAVLHNPLDKKALREVDRLHKILNKRYPIWGGRLECDYASLELWKQRPPSIIVRPWWGFDRFYPAAPAGNEWVINQYFLYRYGLTLDGPEFSSLLPPVDLQEFRKASVMDLFKEWEPKTRDPRWFANSHNQSYIVLNLCRILYTVSGAEPGSKKTAGEWTKTHYPQWKDLVTEAEEWEYGKEMKRNRDSLEFLKFSVNTVKESAKLE
jgi:predicted nucleotidyltransferase